MRPVRAALLYQLRRAAEAEVLKSSRHGGGAVKGLPGMEAELSPAETQRLYVEARRALEALEGLLGEVAGGSPWFSGAEQPGLFDAAVFTYVHLMLVDGRIDWTEEGRRRRRAAETEGSAKLEQKTTMSTMEQMASSLHVPQLLAHHQRLWTRLWPEIDLAERHGDVAGDQDDEADMVHVEEKFRIEISDSVEHIDMTESLLQAR